MATLASLLANEIPPLIMVEVVQEPSIDPKVEVLDVLSLGTSLMDPIVEFLSKDCLPSESKEADKVCRITARFWLSKDRRLY